MFTVSLRTLRITAIFVAMAGWRVDLDWRTCRADWPAVADFEVECIALGSMAGTARDLSGLTGNAEEGTPLDQLGGFSAIDFQGDANRYWVLADRGPADGAASYPCRLHDLQLEIDRAARKIDFHLLSTIRLVAENQSPLLGSVQSLSVDPAARGAALDPEGIRQLDDGQFAIGDEYGPAIDLFSAAGIRQRSWSLPSWMRLTREPNLKIATRGAMPNRGFEGLAVSSDGKSIVAAMQGPLVQDSYAEGNKRYSNYVRLVELPIDGRADARHWLYRLSDPSNGISEILALDQHRYLVLERDGESRSKARFKEIYAIDTRDATNMAAFDQLDPRALPAGTSAVRKELVVSLLDPALAIPDDYSLEKPEGLSWGPRLSDGRRLLIVCFDNDFVDEQESLFLALAFDQP